MVDTGGGNGDSGSARKLDEELELFQVDMATLLVIEVAAGGDRTKTVDQIQKIAVFKGNCVTAIETHGGEDGVVEIVDQLRVAFENSAQIRTVVVVEFRCVKGQSTCQNCVSMKEWHKECAAYWTESRRCDRYSCFLEAYG